MHRAASKQVLLPESSILQLVEDIRKETTPPLGRWWGGEIHMHWPHVALVSWICTEEWLEVAIRTLLFIIVAMLPAKCIQLVESPMFSQSHLVILMKFIIEGLLDLITDGIQALDFHHCSSLIPAPNKSKADKLPFFRPEWPFPQGHATYSCVKYNKGIFKSISFSSFSICLLFKYWMK